MTQSRLVVPRIDLTNEKRLNERAFFVKVADELVRYRTMSAFLLNPVAIYLPDDMTEFAVEDNEVIVTGSVLTKAYFENLVPVDRTISAIPYEAATAPPLPNPTVPWKIQ